jgi:malonyl-CoA decarboxylase
VGVGQGQGQLLAGACIDGAQCGRDALACLYTCTLQLQCNPTHSPLNILPVDLITPHCWHTAPPSPPPQAGLAGVDLGKLLIKRVVEALRAELPQLQHYVTLSPIPNFAAWLTTQIAQGLAAPAPPAPAGGSSKAAAGAAADVPLLQLHEVHALLQLQDQLQQQGSSGLPAAAATQQQPGSDASNDAAALQLLQWLLQDSRWLQLPAAEPVLRPLLLRLCARYLTQEKRRGSALDPVAHFHLRNGAVLWRLNWRADLSPAGLNRSHGLMVNYKYELDEVHGNNRAYVVDQRVCASQLVLELLGPQ